MPISTAYQPALDTVDGHVSTQIRYLLEILRSKPSSAAQIVSVTPTFVRRASSAPPKERIPSSSPTGELPTSLVATQANAGESSYSAFGNVMPDAPSIQ